MDAHWWWWWTAAAAWCAAAVVMVTGQTPTTVGVGVPAAGTPSQQSLQAALLSIDERLRALDSYYTIRFGGRWDVESYVRRLESIESRIGRLETLFEIRTEKLLEAVTAYQMKDTMTKDHINRKIDTLYDRLNHRIAYMENRVDSDVGKIQSSIDSGFLRLNRAERELELVDVETQLHDLQKQFEEFERSQNQTLALLLETFLKASAKTVLNDEDAFKEVSNNMEDVVNKVDKMFNDILHKNENMEVMVKTSMMLMNATRREVQEGFKMLTHRKIIMQQGNKQNKEKEAATSLEGWDALSNLLSKEFGNLVKKIDTNYDELTKDHQLFIQGCHRVQENESQLEAEIASVLERIVERIQNRSNDMEKQVVSLQEMLKSHNSNVIRTISHSTNVALQSTQHTKQLEATILQAVQESKGLEKLSEGLTSVLAGIKVLQSKVGKSVPEENSTDTSLRNCPNDSVIAEQILTTIRSQNSTPLVSNIDMEPISQRIAEKVSHTLKCTQFVNEGDTDSKLSSTGMLPLSEDHVEFIINRTIEHYAHNIRSEDCNERQKLNENCVRGDQPKALECNSSTNASAVVERNVTSSHTTDNTAKVLDILAQETITGETIEYNITNGEDAGNTNIRAHGPTTNRNLQLENSNENNQTNVTVSEKPTGNRTDGSADVDGHTNNEGEARKTGGSESQKVEEKSATGTDVMPRLEEDGDSVANPGENVTEPSTDYEFDKTSSELDQSDPAHYDYDYVQDFSFRDHQAEPVSVNETGKKHDSAERSHMKIKITGLDEEGSSQAIKSELHSTVNKSTNISDDTVKPNGKKATLLVIKNKAKELGLNLNFSSNVKSRNSSESTMTGQESFNETNINTNNVSRQAEANSDTLRKVKPQISQILHRIIAKAGRDQVETSTIGGQTNLLENITPENVESTLKGHRGEVNVKIKKINVTDNPGVWDVTYAVDSEQESTDETQDELYDLGHDGPPSR